MKVVTKLFIFLFLSLNNIHAEIFTLTNLITHLPPQINIISKITPFIYHSLAASLHWLTSSIMSSCDLPADHPESTKILQHIRSNKSTAAGLSFLHSKVIELQLE